MPTRRDNPDAPVKRSFLSRALSGGSGGSKDDRRKSVVGIEGFKRRDRDGELAVDKATRRLSSVAPLPPSLASTDSSLPPSTSSTSLSASHRPSVTRTTSSHSVVSASSVASTSSSTFSTTPKRDRDREQRRQSRRISLYDPENPIFPSPPRRSSVAGSGSRSREASVVSISSASSSTGSSPRRHSHAPSSSPPPPVPAFPPSPSDATAATYIDYTTPLRPTSSASSSSSLARPSFDDPFAISPFVKSGTGLGTAQMDELVAGMRRKSVGSLGVGGGGERRRSSAGGAGGGGRRTRESSVQSGYASASAKGKGKERAPAAGYEAEDFAGGGGEKRQTRRQPRREDSSALGDWSAVRGAVVPQSSSSSSLTGSGRDSRSRETSAASALSDASFASMHALPSPAEVSINDEDDVGLTGAPSMERQETLKALERPWMAALAAASPGGGGGGKRASVALPPSAGAGVGLGGAKTLEEVVGQYRGELRGAAGGGGAGRRKSVGAVREGGMGVEEPPPPIPRLVTADEEPQPNPSTSAPSKPLPYVPFPSASLPPSLILPPASGANGEPTNATRIKTIEEIIAEHAGPSYLAKQRKPSASAPPPSTSSLSSAPREEGGKRSPREREESVQSSLGTKSSVNSLEEEVRLAERTGERSAAVNANGTDKQQEEEDNSETPRLVQSSRSFSPTSTTLPVSPSIGSIDGARVSSAVDSLMNDGFDTRSPSSATTRSHTPSTPGIRSPSPLDAPAPSPSPSSPAAVTSSSSHERDLALLLKSPRLTRLITLRSPPNAGLSVSLADVGSPTGHPVLVFLGLGSVRYLVALYDEVAASYGLRLICVDRWGLGRTGSVPDSQRGFSEWASVVEELVSSSCLDLPRFSILAHSAGAPYAVASAVRPSLSSSVHGSIHLLAPWISTPGDSGTDSLAGPYRFLKYVPTGVLKTAQAAEWKVQAWRLGKPPSVAPAKGVGYDAKAGRLFVELDEAGLEEERARWAAEAPEEGISSPFAPGNGGKLAELYGPEAGVVAAGPANGKGKGWKLLGGGGGRRSSAASSPSGSGEGGLTRSPSSLRPPSMLSKRSSFQGDALSAASSRTLAPSGLPMPLRRSSVVSTQSGSSSPTTPTRRDSLSSFSTAMNGADDGRSPSPYSPTGMNGGSGHLSPTASPLPTSASNASLSPRHGTHSGSLSPTTSRSPSPAHLPSSPSPTPASSIPPHILIDGLLRASHAESLRGGGTADLLVLLDSSSSKRGLGFEYKDLQSPLKVWYGDRDDRISLGSVRWLEREVKDKGRDGRVEVKVVEGADHGLMANGRVMLDVLESIANEWDRPSPVGRSSSSSTATPPPPP